MARPEFDAFLSYAHEDKERVEWLARFLRSYWIPFRRRRRIFLDREHLAAGPLPDGLRRKLRASRYLIVCCSEDARKSSWVSQEIADFHAANGESYDNVRACRVGAPDDDAIPQELTPLDLYLPDLRPSDPKDRIAPAAAVLAPLVGLDDAQQVLARRQRAFAAAAALAFLFITAGLARLWWLRTPAGVHHIVLQRVLDAAGSEPVLDERIGRAAEAVAATDGVDPMRRIALFVPEDIRPAILAAGYLSLPIPDIRKTGYSIDGWNVWNLLAAAFAASGKRDQARMCMAEADRETVRWINGWGWRALALHRLGDGAGAETAFARAETDAAPSDSPAVWIDYVYTLAVTGQWERARRAAETAPNEQVRLLALCSLLELWAQRRPSV